MRMPAYDRPGVGRPPGVLHVGLIGLLVACGAQEVETRREDRDGPAVLAAGTTAIKALRCGGRTIHLDPPPPDPRVLGLPQPVATHDASPGRFVVARWYDARVHARPDPESPVIGYVRRGQRVRVRRGVRGTGCPADMWYELVDGGHACAARDFREGHVEVPKPVAPKLDHPLPFAYARVVQQGTPSFESLPTEEALASTLRALEAGERLTNMQVLEGAYFVTHAELVEHAGHRFSRMDTWRYVLADHVAPVEPPIVHGEPLDGDDALPLAFVRSPKAEVSCSCGDELVVCGTAHRFARLRVEETRELRGQRYVVANDGAWLSAQDVGIAELRSRPESIGIDDQWIHVSLDNQVLVAYEGSRPVYATLVSSGKGEYATPKGLWRVDRKYVSTTMSGDDPDSGTYTVAEVPWTMFYDGDFALHGAYWHTEFGRVRSHGCTNLPPADARWLFAWSGPLPTGWHASSHLKGPWVYITD